MEIVAEGRTGRGSVWIVKGPFGEQQAKPERKEGVSIASEDSATPRLQESTRADIKNRSMLTPLRSPSDDWIHGGPD